MTVLGILCLLCGPFDGRDEARMFFFEKKNQKTFGHLPYVGGKVGARFKGRAAESVTVPRPGRH
jgi:hypothetical protein